MAILLHSCGNNLGLSGKFQDVGSMLFSNSSPVRTDLYIYLLEGVYKEVRNVIFRGKTVESIQIH